MGSSSDISDDNGLADLNWTGGMNRLFAAVAEIKDSRCIVEIGVERCDINVTRKITLFVAMGACTYMCIYVE